jgi:hypothetical protein
MMIKATAHLIAVSVLFLISQQSLAVAYCALRDPTDAIHHFYPELVKYEALDGTVDEKVRDHLTSKLANLHFDEFGTHTLYAVYGLSGTAGFVHARTEKGDYGLDELVWSLTPDLKIQDFRYQRTRSRHFKVIESQPFITWVNGRDHQSLTALITDDGMGLVSRPDFIPEEAEALAVTAIRSAIKTILVTQFVWGDKIAVNANG